MGADIMWEGSGGDFVGVIGIEQERTGGLFHSSAEMPVRISVSLTKGGVTLKVTGRTVTLWDTGERERVAAIAEALIGNAEVDSPLRAARRSLPSGQLAGRCLSNASANTEIQNVNRPRFSVIEAFLVLAILYLILEMAFK